MRAFITGIGGFVGPHLAEHLRQCGDDVAGSSLSGRRDERVEQGSSQSNRPALPASIEVVAWDIAGPPTAAAQAVLSRFAPQVIYHLAAISLPGECGPSEPTPQARAVNVAGVTSVLDLAEALSSRPRVVFVSTSHVYAAVTADAARVTEDARIEPVNGYGRTKLEGETEVRRAVLERGVDALIVRAFKHTGPGQSPRFMLPEWAKQFADPTVNPVHVQTLESVLDITDVRDVVRAYRLVAERGEAGEIFNVGSGVPRRSGDLFDLLRNLADPARAVVETKPGRRQEAIADYSRLHRRTGWTPAIPLEQTIRDIWNEWSLIQSR